MSDTIICPICKSNKTIITYQGKIRNGAPGNLTGEEVSVYSCKTCGAIWHDDIAKENLYNSDDYRESMGETATLDEFYAKHDIEVLDKLNYTGTEVYRNKICMDIGCGGGGFADYICGVASKVILAEPNLSFAGQLRNKGYEVFAYPEDALAQYSGKINVITTYDVIEHVNDPKGFLKTIYDLLKNGGRAFIGTPTDYPVLRSLLGAEFDSFVFSVQHPWVFSSKALEIMARNCSFSKIEVKYFQHFGLGNLIAWLQKRQPKGEATYDFISPELNAIYKSEMAKKETAEYLLLEVTK